MERVMEAQNKAAHDVLKKPQYTLPRGKLNDTIWGLQHFNADERKSDDAQIE